MCVIYRRMSGDSGPLVHHGPTRTRGDVATAEPELAAGVAERLRATPTCLATVQATGAPRIHPVTPIFPADDDRARGPAPQMETR